MKTLNLIRLFTLSIGVLALTLISSFVHAQEYDDMYFNKSDRRTAPEVSVINQNPDASGIANKNITKSTEEYSSKNINPEYIARYKSSEANEVAEPALKDNDGLSSKDYFVENYDNTEYVSDPNKNEIDYAALNKRDQMSTSKYSNYNRPFSSPSWRFSPYMSMGYGYPFYGGGYGYDPFMMGYDPFMMGYGSGLSMGFGFGSGFGYGPTMSYSLGMSWGSGYNPWGGWGGYPGYYSPYGMGGFYDPWGWGSPFAYNPYRYGYPSSYGRYCYGGFYPTVIVTAASARGSEYENGRRVYYGSRATRSTSTPRSRYTRLSEDNMRVSSENARIRVPGRNASTTSAESNGRISSRDYSKVLNEYYSDERRSSNASKQRILTSSSTRNTYSRNTAGNSRFNTSSITTNKPSRSSGYTSGYSRSATNSSSYTGNRSTGRSSSYSQSRSSGSSSFSGRSFSNGGSSRSSSSFSSGSSSGRSSYSGGGSGGARSTSSSSGSSRSGSRQ